jgi:hypothetical protein
VTTVYTTNTKTMAVVTTVTTPASFGPLPLGGLSTLWTYIAYVVIFGGLGLDLAPGNKLRLGQKWLLVALTSNPPI